MHIPTFTDEQVDLFQRRYENGYDLCIDKDYVAWVNINYPGFFPSMAGDESNVDMFAYGYDGGRDDGHDDGRNDGRDDGRNDDGHDDGMHDVNDVHGISDVMADSRKVLDCVDPLLDTRDALTTTLTPTLSQTVTTNPTSTTVRSTTPTTPTQTVTTPTATTVQSTTPSQTRTSISPPVS